VKLSSGGLPCKCLYTVVLRVIYFLCENPIARRPKVVRTVMTVIPEAKTRTRIVNEI
jgi:hypothetical protein